jgi:hypothetical protein
MKRLATATLTLAALFWTAPAAAQTFGFGAHAGVSMPMGDYSDVANTGFSGGLDLTLPLLFVTPALSWYTSVDAAAHGSTEADTDGGFLYFPVLTGARLDVGGLGMIRPFLTGQAGLAFARGPDRGADSPQTGAEFAWALGGGLQLTENIYTGVKWFNLGDVDFGYDPGADWTSPVSFLDIYVGFGVR